jgi:hypothetical protein
MAGLAIVAAIVAIIALLTSSDAGHRAPSSHRAQSSAVGVLPGLTIDSTIGAIDWQRAATAGAKVGRQGEEPERARAITLAGASRRAADAGMKLDWITQQFSLRKPREEYDALGSREKAAVVLIEFGNENWPGGNEGGERHIRQGPEKGKTLTGRQYGEKFLGAAKEGREHEFPVPLGMQVETSSIPAASTWMKELGELPHAELAEAFEPRSYLPSGNWLVSHPYEGKMTTPLKEPDNPYAYEDTENNKWGSERWMNQQALVKDWTGLTVPMAITEYGTAASPYVGNSSGSWSEVGNHIQSFWEFVKKVKEGHVTSAPEGLVPVLALAVYYDEYAWGPYPITANSQSYETFGILEVSEGPGAHPVLGNPNELGHVYEKFKAGAEGL